MLRGGVKPARDNLLVFRIWSGKWLPDFHGCTAWQQKKVAVPFTLQKKVAVPFALLLMRRERRGIFSVHAYPQVISVTA